MSKGINLQRNSNYMSSEILAYNAKYSDPLSLSFKFLIDYSKSSGLFADESKTDSALAYLKRIGETTRYDMLKQWIDLVKIFVREYDFLFLGIDGLDLILNANPGDAFKDDESKITITIRETIDMFAQSLFTTYRHIWFDDIRKVEVLPANLRRFDCFIITYATGIFNEETYGSENILPTPSKLKISENNVFLHLADKYNHQMYILKDVQINNTETGKPFATTVSNENVSEFVKNTLCLQYRFASYKGRFNNSIGEFDFVGILALMAEANKQANLYSFNSNNFNIKKELKNKFGGLKNYFPKMKSSIYDNIQDSKDMFQTKYQNSFNKIFDKTTFIGNAINDLLDPTLIPRMVKNTFDRGVNYLEDKYIDQPFVRLNNLMSYNFGDNVYDLVKNNSTNMQRNIELLNNPVKNAEESLPAYIQKPIPKDIPLGIKLGNSNIYNRKGF